MTLCKQGDLDIDDDQAEPPAPSEEGCDPKQKTSAGPAVDRFAHTYAHIHRVNGLTQVTDVNVLQMFIYSIFIFIL